MLRELESANEYPNPKAVIRTVGMSLTWKFEWDQKGALGSLTRFAICISALAWIRFLPCVGVSL